MAVTVVLMRKDELFRYRLEEGHSVTFGSHKRIMYMWKDFPRARLLSGICLRE